MSIVTTPARVGRKRAIAAVIAAAVAMAPSLGTPARAAEPEPDPRGVTPLDAYRAQSLGLRVEMFASQPIVVRGGEPVGIGYFGQDADEVFAGSASALDAMDTYQTLRTAGFALWATGTTALVAVLVALIADDDLMLDPDRTPNTLFWGLLIGGGVVGITGTFLMNAANDHLSDAVDRYNDDLYVRLREGGPVAGAPGGVRLRVGGAF